MATDPSILSPVERHDLLEAEFVESWREPTAAWLRIGGFESELLWQATRVSFVAGIWVATTLCAQATVERCLAGILSLQQLLGAPGSEPPSNWTKWGLGNLIEHARKQEWVPHPLLNDVQALCDARKPWGHWREPFEPESIQRRTVEASMGQLFEDDFNATARRLLAREAHVSATTAMHLYFGNYRGGPHLGT